MELGIVGLGRMGGHMAQRLLERGHHVVTYDLNPEAIKATEAHGATGAGSLEEMVQRLKPPRALWIMVPAGAAVDSVIWTLTEHLAPHDVMIDGGNSNFHDTVARAARLKEQQGIYLLDAGTSGGIWGLQLGYCLMVGGDDEPVRRLAPIFTALAPSGGYAHVGPPGAGHYVKMIHNGIEYGMLQAYAEGFEIMHASDFELDLHQIAALWNHGSVVRSWLLEVAERAFALDSELRGIRGWVADTGEGRWAAQEAIDKDIPAPIITVSLLERLRSRQEESFSAKVIAALRNHIGGHEVKHE
jgi:6-phosphogluconate dehydrogenase